MPQRGHLGVATEASLPRSSFSRCAAASGVVTMNLFGTGYLAIQTVAVLLFAGLEFKGWSASLPVTDTRAARA